MGVPKKSGKNKSTIMLACSECLQRNYGTPKSKQAQGERLEIKKFCPRCKTHTLHKETP